MIVGTYTVTIAAPIELTAGDILEHLTEALVSSDLAPKDVGVAVSYAPYIEVTT